MFFSLPSPEEEEQEDYNNRKQNQDVEKSWQHDFNNRETEETEQFDHFY